MSNRHTHWMRPLTQDRVPHQNLVMDCEAFTYELDDGTIEHKFLVGAVGGEIFRDSLEMWRHVTTICEKDKSTSLWIYNAEYDIRLSNALRNLGKCGWTIRRFALDDRSCWLTLENKRKRLTIRDAKSFLPGGMDAIYRDHGEGRLGLEFWDAEQRCLDDCAHLAIAIADYYDFLGQEVGGSLAITGPGQSMNHYRRRFLKGKQILVHEWDSVLGAEREAAWCGRSEAWRHGELRGGFIEYDYELAYPHLCLETPLPVEYIGPVEPMDYQNVTELGKYRVYTDLPTLPTHSESGHIIFPTGEFTGWYWQPEADMARNNGALLEHIDSHFYRTAPVLDEWAGWVIENVRSHRNPTIQRVCKQWARSLIGRFGLRYPTWEDYAEYWDDTELLYSPGYDHRRGEETAYLIMNGRMWQRASEEESSNSCPAIMSYIMSLMRVKMWETMQLVGLDNVVYVDTDSLIIDAMTKDAQMPLDFRQKGVYEKLEIFGTRALVIDSNKSRISGIPRGSERDDAGVWHGERWSGPAEGRLGSLETVRTRRQGFTLRGADGRRERLSDGRTEAVRVG